MPTSDDMLSLKPDDPLGKYVIKRIAGQGGMGVVYEAVDPAIGRSVAIKVLRIPATVPPERWKTFVARFRQEARVAGNLSHPNIVTIYGVEAVEERDFIVMEFVPGPTLKREMELGGPLAVERSLGLASQVCDALSYAHARGVVHRDVKPGNIFLSEHDRCKLGDFGIAHLEMQSTSLPAEGKASGAGSVGYMSPEQILGNPADARSDLFSLGVTLAEMLSGRPLLRDVPREQILHAIRTRALATPRGVPPELERLLLKALSFAPEERQQSAEEFGRDLASVATALEAEQQGLISRSPDAQRKVKLLHKTLCGYHPLAPAVDLCSVCGKPICVACLRMYRGTPRCFKCSRATSVSSIATRFVSNNVMFYTAIALILLAILVALRLLR